MTVKPTVPMVSVVTMAPTIRTKRRASRFMVTSGSSIAGGAQKCERARAGLLNWERPVTRFTPIRGPVAQLVEHVTFNHRVAGSSPARLTIESITYRSIQALRGYFGSNAGSNGGRSLQCEVHLVGRFLPQRWY